MRIAGFSARRAAVIHRAHRDCQRDGRTLTERDQTSLIIDPGLLSALTDLVLRAGAVILAKRNMPVPARAKVDNSPVTEADEAAEVVILAGLRLILPGVPVVSEERVAAGDIPPTDATFLLVDPLDGTREFIAGRDEFTVNIALIVDGRPVAGVVAAPALGIAWRGTPGRGAARVNAANPTVAEPVRTRAWPAQAPHALASRSHGDAATAALLRRIGASAEPIGSALKFCRLAEGSADLYARLAPTCEWDIAAGHALLSAAGGAVVSPDGHAITYGHRERDFRIPAFIAGSDYEALRSIL
jgi:3'(2'), 5'-bisphosphate nucleotidase